MISYTPANIKMWARLGSCGAFGMAALELPNIDNSVVILTADLCLYSGLERFRTQYPDRFYNLGIAEQNLIGVAAGMAKEGLNPFATTYASFATTRCCDQVKTNMGYMKLGVKLVGLTSGLSVGILGATHMSIEDIAIMRSIPNITILSPADCTETVKATIAAAQFDGPVYLRLSGVMGNPIVYSADYNFQVGKAITLHEGTDLCIIATGTMVHNSLRAAQMLAEQGIACRVVNMHTLKPLDTEAIENACATRLLVTVEEHSIHGGLGSAVAEYLAGAEQKPPQLMIGIPDTYAHAANYGYLINQLGLTPEKIAARIYSRYQEVVIDNDKLAKIY